MSKRGGHLARLVLTTTHFCGCNKTAREGADHVTLAMANLLIWISFENRNQRISHHLIFLQPFITCASELSGLESVSGNTSVPSKEFHSLRKASKVSVFQHNFQKNGHIARYRSLAPSLNLLLESDIPNLWTFCQYRGESQKFVMCNKPAKIGGCVTWV